MILIFISECPLKNINIRSSPSMKYLQVFTIGSSPILTSIEGYDTPKPSNGHLARDWGHPPPTTTLQHMDQTNHYIEQWKQNHSTTKEGCDALIETFYRNPKGFYLSPFATICHLETPDPPHLATPKSSLILVTHLKLIRMAASIRGWSGGSMW